MSRHADLFAEVLDGAHVDLPHEDEMMVLVAGRLRGMPAPERSAVRPEFRADLRSRLLAEAGRKESADGPINVVPMRRHSESPTWAQRNRTRIVVGAAAGVVTVAGVTVGAAHSLPGNPLYQIKRGGESVQYAFAGSDEARGKLELSFARTRLHEIDRLTSHNAAFGIAAVPGPQAAGGNTVLAQSTSTTVVKLFADMDSEATKGSNLLARSFLNHPRPGPMLAVQKFARDQQLSLTALKSRLAGPALKKATVSLAWANTVVAQTTTVLASCTATTCPPSSVAGLSGPLDPGPVPVPMPSAPASAPPSAPSSPISTSPIVPSGAPLPTPSALAPVTPSVTPVPSTPVTSAPPPTTPQPPTPTDTGTPAPPTPTDTGTPAPPTPTDTGTPAPPTPTESATPVTTTAAPQPSAPATTDAPTLPVTEAPPTEAPPPPVAPPTAAPPATTPPVIEPPATTPPVIEPPATTPPVIEPPATTPPVTDPTPTTEPAPSPSPTPTPTPTDSISPTPTPTPTDTVVPSDPPTPTGLPVPTDTPTVTLSATVTPIDVALTPEVTPTPTPTDTVPPTPTVEPTPTDTVTPTPTPIDTLTPTPTVAPSPSDTILPTPTVAPTSTDEASPTVTPTDLPTLLCLPHDFRGGLCQGELFPPGLR